MLAIPRHSRVKSYGIRVAAAHCLERHGIPVAKIIEYHLEEKDIPEYLVFQKIKGEHIDLETLTLQEQEKAHFSAGEILNAIHGIREIAKYGRLNAQLIGSAPSWEEFIRMYFKESLERLRENRELWAAYSEKLIHEYESHEEIVSRCIAPQFLHADFHLGNLLFKDLRVSAVLDLDLITGGDPAWDSCHYQHTFNTHRTVGVASFKEGYGRQLDARAEYLYSLVIWTRKIGSQAKERPEALQETIPELDLILSYGSNV